MLELTNHSPHNIHYWLHILLQVYYMYLTTNILGETGATGVGTNVSISIEGESQQHIDYSTLLVSLHFTVTTNITSVAGRQSQSHYLLSHLHHNNLTTRVATNSNTHYINHNNFHQSQQIATNITQIAASITCVATNSNKHYTLVATNM